MCWLRPLFSLLIVGLCINSAKAADQTSESVVSDLQSGLVVMSGEQSPLPESTLDNSAGARRMRNYGVVELDTSGNVCYTMRSYKVKPREHFAEGESGRAGYSTCERASTFRFRSADEEGPIKLK